MTKSAASGNCQVSPRQKSFRFWAGLELGLAVTSDSNRVVPAETAGTQRQTTSGAGLPETVDADIAEAIRPDKVPDLRDGLVIGDKVFLAVDVGAEVAGVGEGRR